jgi:hypothetical protein
MLTLLKAEKNETRFQGIKPIVTSLMEPVHVLFNPKDMVGRLTFVVGASKLK